MGPTADNSPLQQASRRRYHRWLLATLCLASPLALASGASEPWSCSTNAAGQWVCQPLAPQTAPAATPQATTTETKPATAAPTTATPPAQSAAPPAPTETTAATNAKLTKSRPLTAADLDWHPRSALTAAQRAKLPPFCPGMYIEPANTSPTAGVPFRKADVNATADSSNVVPNKRAVLDGNVRLTRGDLRVTANHAVVDMEAKTVTLDGNIIIRDNGRMVRGNHAVISTADGTGTLDNAYYVFYQGQTRGNADVVRRVNDDITVLTRGSYTRCPPDSEAWKLTAKKFTVNQATGLGTAKNAVLRVADIPVFWLPYATYPVDNRRRSGFLWPSIASAKGTGGLDLTVPYYWNIAPATDATIAPRYIKGRGLDTELEVRHLNRYSKLVTSGSYLNDQNYGRHRWLIGVDEDGKFGSSGWFHSILYTKVSDDRYFNDLSTQSLEVKRQTHLVQQGLLNYFGPTWHFSTLVRRYQTIDPNLASPYEELPQLTLSKDWSGTPFHPDWMFLTQATYFDNPASTRARGSRLYTEPGVGFPMEWAWGFVKPEVKALGVAYQLDQGRLAPGAESKPSTVTPLASIDSGLYFDRSTKLFGSSYTQSLEPRLYYLYVEPKNQADQPLFDTAAYTFDYHQLWRESRFTGHDRLADANQFSLGVSTNLINTDTGVTTFSASIGEIFYIGNRSVTLGNAVTPYDRESRSDVAAEASWSPSEAITTTGSLVWNPYTGNYDSGGLQLAYRGPNNTIFNIAQRYRRNVLQLVSNKWVIGNISQTDVSAIIPVSRDWALLGRWNYDYIYNRKLEQLVGVEYNSCCWLFRVLYQAGINGNDKRTEGIYFEFQLKGLGGLGTTVDNILQDSIPGYQSREKSLQE